MANIAYTSIENIDESVDEQTACFIKNYIKIDQVFSEKALKHPDDERPKLNAMLACVKTGDTVYIESIGRLARGVKDFVTIGEQLESKGARLVSLKEGMDTTTSQGKCMFAIFALLSRMDKERALRKQAEGIARAKKDNKTLFGRPKLKLPRNTDAVIKRWRAGEMTARAAMKLLKISKASFYKRVRELERP